MNWAKETRKTANAKEQPKQTQSQSGNLDTTFKKLSTVQETWVRSLVQKDPLEREMVNHSSILAWEIPWRAWQATVHGIVRVGHDLVTKPSPPTFKS